MTNEDLQQLKALALTATNEAWEFDQAFTPVRIAGGEVVGDDPLPYGDVNTKALYQTPDGEECLVIAAEVGEANGRFIAAANPATILALIERIESLAADATKYQGWRDGYLADDESFMNSVYAYPHTACPDYREPTAPEWDTAVDAAMAKEKP